MQVGVLEAKNRLSELLELAAAGEEVVVTKHGRPFVELKPAARRVEDLDELFERIKRRRKQMGLKLTPEEIKSYIEDGRM